MPRLSLLLAAVALVCPSIAHAQSKPLKVYILAGQSNMEGHAHVSTFDYVGLDPKTKPLHDLMTDDKGEPAIADSVWISYHTGMPDRNALGEGHGKLTAGYGSRPNPAESNDKIGPEYLFGLRMDEAYDGPILIIKTAWGGKSLNVDFRPPSAAPYEFPQATLDKWAERPEGAHGIPRASEVPKRLQEKRDASGLFYRLMVEHVNKVLADPKTVVPNYDAEAGYEIAGFVWFQGWNDMVDDQTYPGRDTPEGYAEYTRLMSCFIRDVRKDLGAPDLPFVIGVIGVGGEKASGGIANLAHAMRNVAKQDEFKGNVAAVETAPFWDYEMEALGGKEGQIKHALGAAYTIGEDGFKQVLLPDEPGWEPIGKVAPAEREWRFATFDPIKPEDELEKRERKRFRDVTLSDDNVGWNEPGFDDSAWRAGKAPIGTGVWKEGKFPEARHRTNWGGSEFVLMRSTFELDEADLNHAAYRMVILNRQGFRVFLNGEQIEQYVWWQSPQYRGIALSDKEVKLLKPGKNVLAIYTWANYDRKGDASNAVDAWIEGISEEDFAHVNSDTYRDKIMHQFATPEEAQIIRGKSNGGYHYLGSAKIIAQIGDAFAKAMLKLEE